MKKETKELLEQLAYYSSFVDMHPLNNKENNEIGRDILDVLCCRVVRMVSAFEGITEDEAINLLEKEQYRRLEDMKAYCRDVGIHDSGLLLVSDDQDEQEDDDIDYEDDDDEDDDGFVMDCEIDENILNPLVEMVKKMVKYEEGKKRARKDGFSC